MREAPEKGTGILELDGQDGLLQHGEHLTAGVKRKKLTVTSLL